MRIKGLSLLQPWASLVAVGAKKFETRSWQTQYRGPVLICASKRYPAECRELVDYDVRFRMALMGSRPTLPANEVSRLCGQAVCIVDLVECWKIFPQHLYSKDCGTLSIPLPDERERAFGDYTPGRYAWQLENLRPLAEPFPVKGALHLFDVDIDVKLQEAGV